MVPNDYTDNLKDSYNNCQSHRMPLGEKDLNVEIINSPRSPVDLPDLNIIADYEVNEEEGLGISQKHQTSILVPFIPFFPFHINPNSIVWFVLCLFYLSTILLIKN